MKLRKLHVLMAMLVVLSLAFAGPAAAKKMVPKVDNFIWFVDHSGSMNTAYKSRTYVQWGGISKISLAKTLLKAMNEKTPELGYQAGLYTFAPYKEYAGMATYSSAAMEGPISAISTDYPIYPRVTPMGWGLSDLDNVVGGLSGKTAVIIFSDGASNRGSDPVAVAKSMVDKYGDKICFHIVSYADTAKGEEILKQIAALSPCTCMSTGEDLVCEENLVKFLECALYEWVEDEIVIFRSIYFDFDKYNIKKEFIPVLDEGVAIVQSKPETLVILEGHTDSIGTEQYNQGLSERRANSVAKYFVKQGVDEARITAIGYGELQPAADNATAEGRKLNRRCVIKFKNQ